MKFPAMILLPVVCLLLFTKSTFARTHPAYSQDEVCTSQPLNFSISNEADPRWWMSTIPNFRPLQLISIPGTHDSLARYGSSKFPHMFETQTMSLENQLNTGIRAFDIRCRLVSNECAIYHQFVSQKINLDEVLSICESFLTKYPSEVIILRVKDKEELPIDSNQNFEDVFVERYWKKYTNLLWQPKKDLDLDLNFPIPIGEVRGKVLILQYFKSSRLYSLPFKHSYTTQSHWTQFSRATLYLKWTIVRDHLMKTNESASIYFDPGPFGVQLPFYTNWLSGALTVEPFFVASGHIDPGTDGRRHTCSKHYFGKDTIFPEFPRSHIKTNSLGLSYTNVYCEGTNIMTYEKLKSERFRFVGIIFADFPGCGLIQAIIDVNKNF